MPKTFYEDGTIIVTDTAIKGPQFTMYLDQIPRATTVALRSSSRNPPSLPWYGNPMAGILNARTIALNTSTPSP